MNTKSMRLADISELITKGTTPTTLGFRFTDNGIGFLRVQNIEGGKISYLQNVLYIDSITHSVLKRSQIRPGDVLVSIAGSVGRSAVVPDKVPELNCNQAVAIVRTKTNSVYQPYLRYWLESRDAQSQMRGATVTGTISNLSLTQLGNLKLPLPPIAEQRRIAAILDKAEELRKLRRQALRKLDVIAQSIFIETFGDPITNPKGWAIHKLSDVGSLDRGISKHRPRNAPELLGGKYPLIQTGGVANCDRYIRNHTSTYSEVGLKQSRMWPAGTLCITIAANIAKTGILTFDACFPDSVVGFRSNKLSTIEYVQTWLSFLQATLEATAPESAQKNINLSILRNLTIPVPPLELQQAFKQQIEALEQLKTAYRESLAQIDVLFASLEHCAFRGEL